MTADEKISSLLAEAANLETGKDSVRLCAIYTQAADLVDRSAKPKKWAAFRFLYGQAIDPIDPGAALTAFREVVPYFDSVVDRSAWMSCKASIGFGLAALGKVSSSEIEEVISCLEAALPDFPYAASTLATYYAGRSVGDPLENWRKQTRYLQMALEQVSPENDMAGWATLKTDLVNALAHEPDGDFAARTEERIKGLQEVLQALNPWRDAAGSRAQNCWILVSTNLSESYLSRSSSDASKDRSTAIQYARAAYEICGPEVSKPTAVMATLALARTLLNEDGSAALADAAEGLKLCIAAKALIDEKTQPVLMATALKFVGLGHLRFLQAGQAEHLVDLLRATDMAYSLLDPLRYADFQRVLMQVAADGLLSLRDYEKAVSYLERAAEACDRSLEQATTQAGRLEGIFSMSDTYARLGFCLFQAGQIGAGLEALDRGKGRLWRPAGAFVTFEQIRTLVPKGGALLFPAFAPEDGAVAVLSEKGEAICALPGFGRNQLKELLLGDLLNADSQCWITRYLFRNRDKARWLSTIDSISGTLFQTIWTPLLKVLASFGVQPGAELVFFPQAGLGILPLHAAWEAAGGNGDRSWILDRYAIRYAPSASCLHRNQAVPFVEKTLVVSDPAGDLPNSALEASWVQRSDPDADQTLLAGVAATKERVLKGLEQARRVHFSTHAVFRVDDPFQSGVLLANNEMLQLSELLPLLSQTKLQEVILSGCETAMAQVARRPDELLGFPAAFLEHGARTVVATQWPIDDWAASALVGRLYKEWRIPGRSAAYALQAAQTWMRNVTASELRELLKPLRDEAAPVGGLASQLRSSLSALDPEAKPFAHPFFWAPFTITGF